MSDTIVHNFCTLFDKRYLFRGLALHDSLVKQGEPFVLWVLCMDDEVYQQLSLMNLVCVRLVRLVDVEDDELLVVKPGRSVAEYCWTLSSSLPLYVLKQDPTLPDIAYLDCDLYFYSSFKDIYTEMGDKSIYIVRHNYPKELVYLEERSGIYNVGLVVIKNNDIGIRCLRWWREKCLEWCFSRFEDGKFGDQIYLNNWIDLFGDVCVSKHKGVNVAPWNINKYNVTRQKDGIFIDEDPLVFYHFHSFKMFGYNQFMPYQNFYLIRPQDEQMIYTTYTTALNTIIRKVQQTYPQYIYGFDRAPSLMNKIKYWLKKKLFVFFYLKSLLT